MNIDKLSQNQNTVLFIFQPSTFQAVLYSDGCDTYVMFLYQPQGMLWNTLLRIANNVLIGWSNGQGFRKLEVQGNYRPDNRVQSDGNQFNNDKLPI